MGHVHGGTVVGGRGVIFCSTNTGQTRRLRDGRLLMRRLRARQGDVHVAHHWKSPAGVFRVVLPRLD